jgi:hypothetical protein
LFGCLEEQRREERMQLFMWLSIVLLVIGLNAALIAAVLERRLTRINHLGIQRSLAGKSWLA